MFSKHKAAYPHILIGYADMRLCEKIWQLQIIKSLL